MDLQLAEQQEFLNRYCQWALNSAKNEVKAEFPFVAKIKGTDSLMFLEYMSRFHASEQVVKTLGLVRHAQSFLLGIPPTPEDRRAFEDYNTYCRNRSSAEHFQRNSTVRTALVRDVINAKVLAKAIRDNVSDSCGETGKRTGLEWNHSRTFGEWRVSTWFQVKSTNVQVRYHHTIHKNNGPMIGGFIDIFRSVGGGQAVWDLIQPGEELATGQAIGEICAHFMQSVQEIIGC